MFEGNRQDEKEVNVEKSQSLPVPKKERTKRRFEDIDCRRLQPPHLNSVKDVEDGKGIDNDKEEVDPMAFVPLKKVSSKMSIKINPISNLTQQLNNPRPASSPSSSSSSSSSSLKGYFVGAISDLISDRFRIVSSLGKGVFASVYQCVDVSTSTEVANRYATASSKSP